jgi:hypothetical protein
MTQLYFELTNLRSKVAMQKALARYLHQPKVFGRECPFCQSLDFVKYSFEQGKQRYRCRSCCRRFNERPVFECSCPEIGQSLHCQDCPQFQSLLEAAKQYLKEIENWSIEELRYFLEQKS